MASTVVTARLDADTLESLDRLADVRERSRAWLVAKAVKRFVEEESAFDALIDEGDRDFERGDFVTHDQLIENLRDRRRHRHAA